MESLSALGAEGGPSPPVPRANTLALILLLGAVQALMPLSVDMYLPAFPRIQADFVASQAGVQLTLSTYLVGFAGGQLFWGPLGDRYGRRLPMMLGLALYVAASFGCAAAPSIHALAVLRFVQASGACASAVLGSAMVRDLFERDEGARVRSLMGLVTQMAPLVAPLLGGQLLRWFDWHAIFVTLGLCGAVALAALWFLPESLQASRRRPLHLGDMLRGYGMLLADREYFSYASSSSFMMAGMLAYIAGTPFVYIEYFGVSPQLYGFLFGLNVVGMMLLGVLNSRLVTRLGSDRILRLGIASVAIAGIVLAMVGRLGFGGLAGIVIPLLFYVPMIAPIGANATAGALENVPDRAGAAAGLMGVLGTGLGAIAATLVGWWADGTPWPMTAVMAVLGLLAFASDRLRRSKTAQARSA